MGYKIHKADCYEQLREIESKTVDLILTDPPYIISKGSNFASGSKKAEYNCKYGNRSIDFGEWDKEPLDLDSLAQEFYRVLKQGGTAIIFYDIWKMGELKQAMLREGFKQPRIGNWTKTNPMPINRKLNYMSNAKEYFATFVKGSKPTFNSEGGIGDTYCLPLTSNKERTGHPTQKPLKLMKILIEKHSNAGDVVLDPFMGSGTTGAGCIELGRDFIGIERDERWYSIASKRLKEESLGVQVSLDDL